MSRRVYCLGFSTNLENAPRYNNLRWTTIFAEKQKRSYEKSNEKILIKLVDLKRRLESNSGKPRDKSSVVTEINGIIYEKFKAVIGYEVGKLPQGKKKPSLKTWINEDVEKKRYAGMLFYSYLAWKYKHFHLSLRRLVEELDGIRLALVKEKTNNKVELVVEEMNSKQASLFSLLDMGVYMENRQRDDLLLIGTMIYDSLAIDFMHIFETQIEDKF